MTAVQGRAGAELEIRLAVRGRQSILGSAALRADSRSYAEVAMPGRMLCGFGRRATPTHTCGR
jgi:hypothetical protein